MNAVDYPTISTGSLQAPTERRIGLTFNQQFVNALRACADYTGKHSIYLCSLVISPIDEQAGRQIAWLRKQAFALGAIPKAEEERGAMGEWMILRRAKHLADVEPVSLVSMSSVCEPDLILRADPAQQLAQVNIDIKTTAAKSPPEAHYNLTGNVNKGMPHFLAAVLATKRNPDNYADLYFVNAAHTLTPAAWLQAQHQTGNGHRVITPNTSHSIPLADAFRKTR